MHASFVYFRRLRSSFENCVSVSNVTEVSQLLCQFYNPLRLSLLNYVLLNFCCFMLITEAWTINYKDIKTKCRLYWCSIEYEKYKYEVT
jgi:hypothetical protein